MRRFFWFICDVSRLGSANTFVEADWFMPEATPTFCFFKGPYFYKQTPSTQKTHTDARVQQHRCFSLSCRILRGSIERLTGFGARAGHECNHKRSKSNGTT